MNWKRIGIPLFVFILAVTVAGYAAASQMHTTPAAKPEPTPHPVVAARTAGTTAVSPAAAGRRARCGNGERQRGGLAQGGADPECGRPWIGRDHRRSGLYRHQLSCALWGRPGVAAPLPRDPVERQDLRGCGCRHRLRRRPGCAQDHCGDAETDRLRRLVQLHVGQFVLAMGNPLGYQQTVTFGIVSTLGRGLPEGQPAAFLPNLIQTSAPINPGNSGGALVDLYGRLVGIPTLAAQDPEQGTAAQGIGFAIPVNRVRVVTAQIIAHGKVTNSGRAFLGISELDVTPDVQANMACRSITASMCTARHRAGLRRRRD